MFQIIIIIVTGSVLALFFSPALPLLRVTWFAAPGWGKVLIATLMALGIPAVSVLIYGFLGAFGDMVEGHVRWFDRRRNGR